MRYEYTPLMVNVEQAKNKLKKGGWSYRSAAPVLGCTYQWIARVLNGHECSEPLLAAIEALPTFDQWRRANDHGN